MTPDQERVIAATEAFVQGRLPAEPTGHDWPHAFRVRRLALEIAKKEGADPYVVQLAALLHDIADHKFHQNEKMGAEVTRDWLSGRGVGPEIIEQVVFIVDNISFKKTKGKSVMTTIEGKVVQDADRLEAIGAIGIARAFVYGGMVGELIHSTTPGVHSVTGHFHEKLLKLKDLMNTETGKQLAAERHEFVVQFLAHLEEEWG